MRGRYIWVGITMTDTTLMSEATFGAFDPMDLDVDTTAFDRLAASLEALALTFGDSNGKQSTTHQSPCKGRPQHDDGVTLAA
jgi:hypothetical protein